MSDLEIHERLEEVKRAIGWGETMMRGARTFWQAFEDENRHQLGVVLRLAEELAAREATISELFISYVHSPTDNIKAHLIYLAYTRLRKKVVGLRKDLGWESADHEARRWWRSREDASGGDLAALVELMERLSNASVTIRECFETSRRYGRLELAQVVEIIEASRRGGRSMRGDCSRRRRFHPLRRPWYSHYRAIRLAQRILGPRGIDPLVAFKALAADASTRPNPQ